MIPFVLSGCAKQTNKNKIDFGETVKDKAMEVFYDYFYGTHEFTSKGKNYSQWYIEDMKYYFKDKYEKDIENCNFIFQINVFDIKFSYNYYYEIEYTLFKFFSYTLDGEYNEMNDIDLDIRKFKVNYICDEDTGQAYLIGELGERKKYYID